MGPAWNNVVKVVAEFLKLFIGWYAGWLGLSLDSRLGLLRFGSEDQSGGRVIDAEVVERHELYDAFGETR